MMITSDETTATADSRPGRTRWSSDAQPCRTNWRAGRRRRLLLFLISLALIGAAVPVIRWRLEPPRSEPRFEGIVDETPGPVKEFAFKDIRDTSHTLADWADRPGIVLIFLGTECPVSNAYAPEMARLARAYAARGIVFYGIHCDPEVTRRIGRRSCVGTRFTVPDLARPAPVHRPAGRCTRDSRSRPPGIRWPGALPRADRRPVFARTASAGRRHGRTNLENAIKAVLADELPAVAKPSRSVVRSRRDASGSW